MFDQNSSRPKAGMRNLAGVLAATVAMAVVSQPTQAETSGRYETNSLVQFSDAEWGPLNPARGTSGPQAADLWGNRKTEGASGMLVQFRKGFSSPPHVHNVSYRGIVISGLIHNDDPDAEAMWLTPGSYWTQPAGDNHITAAAAETNLAYIEIDDGPYLVHPTNSAFNNGEVPVNVDQSNLVWLNASDIEWFGQGDSNTEMAFLWGTPNKGKPYGSLVKLPNGFEGRLQSKASELRVVTIQGLTSIIPTGETKKTTLDPGSYFGATGARSYDLSCNANENCVIYLRANDVFRLTSGQPQ